MLSPGTLLERQKATRNLKKLLRILPQPHERSQSDSIKLLDAQIDLNYTLHFPSYRKYISLYRDSGADAKTEKAKDEIRADIKKKMEEGTLGKRETMTRYREGEGDEELHHEYLRISQEYQGPANEMNGQNGKEEDTRSESKRRTGERGAEKNGRSKDQRKPRLKQYSNAEEGSSEPAGEDSFFEV